MIRVEEKHTFPVPLSKAFSYITNMDNWPAYWPDFVRIHNPTDAQWGQPGDKITIVMKLLNRETELTMTLEKFQKDTLVTYTGSQPGLPDTFHERHFKAVPEGFEYTLVVSFEPRQGLQGLSDRLFVKRGTRQALRKTIENLDRVLKQ
jgi:hypothetical protein